MKLMDLKNVEQALPKLLNLDLPVLLSYQLHTKIKDIEMHLGRLNEFRIQFIQKHGEDKGDGNYSLSDEVIQEFDKGLEEIMMEEINLEPVPIPLSHFIDSNIKFSAIEINALKNSGFLSDDINSNE